LEDQFMRDQGQLRLGIVLVVLGLVFLLSNLFDINLWPYCWSVGLIGLGVWLVMRPRMVAANVSTNFTLIGDLRRRGSWVVQNEEIWHGIGDVEIDLTQAEIPSGESVIRIFSFVGDVNVFAPASVGLLVRSSGFFVDADLLGEKIETFLSPAEGVSQNYASADRRVRVELTSFVAEMKARQA
jgi:predicted membrane protein